MTDDNGLRLNLGCGKHPLEGWVNIDQSDAEGVTNIDLDRAGLHLPWPSGSVDEVYGSHVIEHITHTLPLMAELWRVCKPDARATFACPYGSSDDAWENQTHVREMYVGSWSAFGQPYYWREDYGYTADWVTEEVRLRMKRDVIDSFGGLDPGADDGHEADLLDLWRAVQEYRNVVTEMVATLRCNKPARAADRELQEDKVVIFEVLEPVSPWENRPREVGRLQMGLPR